jgi:uncharacterized protein (TIGR02246 family)
MTGFIRRSALVIAIALVGACTSAPPPAPPPPDTSAVDTAAINKLRADYQAAWEAGDAERLGRLVAEDAVQYLDQQRTLVGRAAFVEFNKKSFSEITPSRFKINSEEMKLMGDWAFDRGTIDIAFTPKAKGAKPITSLGRYLVILHRDRDGMWRLARDVDNAMPPPPPPPPPPGAKGKGK